MTISLRMSIVHTFLMEVKRKMCMKNSFILFNKPLHTKYKKMANGHTAQILKFNFCRKL